MQRLVTGLSAHSQPTAGPIRARCDSAAAALAHEPRGVRTPRESAPCPRELALRARERDTSSLPRLPTPSVCSAVRASLCERDEQDGGSFVWHFAASAHRNHAPNAMHPEMPDKRPSESHTSRATDVLSRVLSLVPASRVQIVDERLGSTPSRARSWFRTAGFNSQPGAACARARSCTPSSPRVAVPHPRPCTPFSRSRARSRCLSTPPSSQARRSARRRSRRCRRRSARSS